LSTKREQAQRHDWIDFCDIHVDLKEDAAMFAPKIAKAKAAEIPTGKLAPQRALLSARPFGGSAVEQEHFHQRTLGNEAMLQLLSQRGFSPTREGNSGNHEQDGTPENTVIREASRGAAWDFSKIPVFPPNRANRAQVRSSLSEQGATSALPSLVDNDAAEGQDDSTAVDPGAITNALLATGLAAPAYVPDGGTVALPDLIMPAGLQQTEQDDGLDGGLPPGGTAPAPAAAPPTPTPTPTPAAPAPAIKPITAALTYSPSVQQTGVVSPFGATSWATFNMTGQTVASNPSGFNVSATVENPITFNVASGGRTDITSDSDPDLTSTNYRSAASDLTPNMSDLKGRPPRNSFWASDLTITHEQFHVSERQTHGREGVTNAQTWLNAQTAGSAADVQNLLTQVPGKVIATSQAAMTMPGKEERAYSAGAPLYSGRAVAIKTKGDAGSYPAPPAPPSP
jgi:hypothetical protein